MEYSRGTRGVLEGFIHGILTGYWQGYWQGFMLYTFMSTSMPSAHPRGAKVARVLTGYSSARGAAAAGVAQERHHAHGPAHAAGAFARPPLPA